MSLDYPEYLKLKQKSRWFGVLWRVGDAGYYIGLLGGIGTLVWFLLSSDSLSTLRSHLPQAGMVFLSFSLLFGCAALLKRYAHRQGGYDNGRNADDH